MVRRRSSMMSGVEHPMASVTSTSTAVDGSGAGAGAGAKRWSNAPEYTLQPTKQGDEEERLDSDLDLSKKNSRDRESIIRRASYVPPLSRGGRS